jgi:hypothetical protein
MGSKVGVSSKPPPPPPPSSSSTHPINDNDDNEDIVSSKSNTKPSNDLNNFSLDHHQRMAQNTTVLDHNTITTINNTNKRSTNHHDNDETNNNINSDFRKVNARKQSFINLEALTTHIDPKALTDIFNSYATKKTLAAGFFNLALVATNFAQMKALIAPSQGRTTVWNPLNIVIMTFIGLSLVLQFIVAILLVFLAKQGEFIDEEKRNQLIRSNNGTTLLVAAISVINIFINIFISI